MLGWSIVLGHNEHTVCCAVICCPSLCCVTAQLLCTYCTEQGTGSSSSRAVTGELEREFFPFFFLVRFVRSESRRETGKSIFLQQLSNTVCVECEAVRERVQFFNFSKKIDRNIEIFKIFVLQKNVRVQYRILKTIVLLAIHPTGTVCGTNLFITRLKCQRHPDSAAKGWG